MLTKVSIVLVFENAFVFNIMALNFNEILFLAIFLSLLHSSMNSASIELISLLINRNTAVIPQVMKFINKDENIQKSNLIFTFLGSNLTFNWDKQFLLKLYKLHKNEIVKYVTEPADKISWIHENIKAVIYLVESSVG